MNNQLLFKMLEGQNIENKYYLNKLLGSGGFGGVYLADEVVRDRLIRTVALKLIITDNPDKQLDELIFSTTLEHPNLINCYTCGECKLNNIEFLYLLMEKADYTLEDELKKGKLPEEKVKPLVLDIANGLDYLHRQKPIIVHRDLKPGNILRVGDKWKISDFGLVRSLKNTATQTSTISGTIAYAPPEAYDGNISPSWDIWSLGVIIYESLTGKLPFNGDSLFQLMRQVINSTPDYSFISDYWQEIIKGCLIKDHNQRFLAKQLSDNSQENFDTNNTIQETFITEKNNLKIGEFLSVNEFLTSTNKQYSLVLQEDGNLVLYDCHSSKSIWASNTNGRKPLSAVMQDDGNFVVYFDGSNPWASNTANIPISCLTLENNGTLALYQRNRLYKTIN
jgi:serine/threonine protein kinase